MCLTCAFVITVVAMHHITGVGVCALTTAITAAIIVVMIVVVVLMVVVVLIIVIVMIVVGVVVMFVLAAITAAAVAIIVTPRTSSMHARATQWCKQHVSQHLAPHDINHWIPTYTTAAAGVGDVSGVFAAAAATWCGGGETNEGKGRGGGGVFAGVDGVFVGDGDARCVGLPHLEGCVLMWLLLLFVCMCVCISYVCLSYIIIHDY